MSRATDEKGVVRAHSDVTAIGRSVSRPPAREVLGIGLKTAEVALPHIGREPLCLLGEWTGDARWRDLLVWQGLHLLSWVITGWYVGEALVPTVADDARAYWLAILLRVVGLGWLVAAVLRQPGSTD